MDHLEGALRTYPWGSRTLLADLRGTASPAPTPEAELWFGAHPAAPSTIGGEPLDALIAADPQAALGDRVAQQFDGQLPFLVKLLAAGEPLSIQAHPSREQAAEGFARENAQGLALDDPRRNYKDPNPKPELIVALTEFKALAGFRPTEATQELFAQLGPLERYVPLFQAASPEEGLRAVFTTLITLPSRLRAAVLTEVEVAARELAAGSGWMADVATTFLQLTRRYPGDIGALAALMLNLVTLAPGGALYLEAGQPHAYLSGLGVEVMANSDNVLRGGLTSKHVDVPELARVLNFEPLADPTAECVVAGTTVTYRLPIEEFRVERHSMAHGEQLLVDATGPAIILCTSGRAESGELVLDPGQAAWVPARDQAATFTSVGGELAELFLISA